MQAEEVQQVNDWHMLAAVPQISGVADTRHCSWIDRQRLRDVTSSLSFNFFGTESDTLRQQGLINAATGSQGMSCHYA